MSEGENGAFVVTEEQFTQIQTQVSQLQSAQVVLTEKEKRLELQMERAREDADRDFQKPGSRKNFKFVRGEEQRYEDLETELQKCAAGPRVDRMKGIVQKGKDACIKRRKQIVLADKHGWDVVEEMEQDSDVDDDDGDNKLRKAQKRVDVKREKSKQAKKPGKGGWKGGKGRGKGGKGGWWHDAPPYKSIWELAA